MSHATGAGAAGGGGGRNNEGFCTRTLTTNGNTVDGDEGSGSAGGRRAPCCEAINWEVEGTRMSGLPIEKALRAADEALSRAQRELSSGRAGASNQPSVVDEVNEEGEAEPPANSTDPDDLAAAFFAAQAKKQGAENRLPATEWAQLFPGLRLQTGCSNTNVTQQSEEEMKNLIKEQLVERLHQEYKKELADK